MPDEVGNGASCKGPMRIWRKWRTTGVASMPRVQALSPAQGQGQYGPGAGFPGELQA